MSIPTDSINWNELWAGLAAAVSFIAGAVAQYLRSRGK